MCDMGPNAVIRRLTFYDLFIIRSAVRAVTFKVQGQGNEKSERVIAVRWLGPIDWFLIIVNQSVSPV